MKLPRAAVKSTPKSLMERNSSSTWMNYCAKERARCLVKAVEAEVTAYIEAHQHEVDENGRRLVVRNGHARERTIVSGAGQLKIQRAAGRRSPNR